MARGSQDGQPGEILHVLGVVDNLHGPPTEDEGGTDDHRISDGVGDRQCVGDRQGRAVGRLHEVQLVEHGLEQFPVFGPVDAFRLGTQNGNPFLMQRRGEIQRGLPAELDDHTVGFFLLHDMEHILAGQGSK
jgi:hypothetical protein